MPNPRTLIASPHVLILDAIEELLASQCAVIGKVTDEVALITAACQFEPDVVIIDRPSLALDTLSAAARVRRFIPRATLIILTQDKDATLEAGASGLGAYTVRLDSSVGPVLVRTIAALYPEPVRQTVELPVGFSQPSSHRADSMFSSLQQTILRLLGEGYRVEEIAALLQIKPRTVAYYKYAMMDIVDVDTSAELLSFARREGLLSA